MNKLSLWFRGLTNTGKIVIVSIGSLLTLGTFSVLAQPNTSESASSAYDANIGSNIEPTPILKKETKVVTIPFQEESKDDNNLEKGQTKISQEGLAGERTITYEVTMLQDKEISRKEISNEITKAPINKINLVGTYVAPVAPPKPKSSCDSNYSGACVPIANDVDCAGGKGNGPAYVSGPVYVVGSDIYDLDRDGNGVGCE